MPMEYSATMACVTTYEPITPHLPPPTTPTPPAPPNIPVVTEGNNNYLTEIQIDDGKWTREQTQILINTWKENKHILLNSSSSSSEQFKVWKDILKEVNKLAPPKSLQQCKKKFRNIRYICKTAMNNNKQLGSKKHYPMFYSDFVDIISEYEQSRNNYTFSDMNFKMEMVNENSHDDWTVEYNRDNVPCSPDNRTRSPGRENRNFTIPMNEPLPPKSSPGGEVVSSEAQQRSPKIIENGEIPAVYPSSPSTSQPNDRNIRKRSNDGDEMSDMKNDVNKFDKFDKSRQNHQKYMGPNPQENIIRKHGNSFVSIMGHHYPPPKRVRHSTNTMTPQPAYHHNEMQPLRQQPRQIEFHKEFFPTMAMKPGCHDGVSRPDEGAFPPQHIYAKQNDKQPHIVAISNNTTNFDKGVKPLHNHDVTHGTLSPACVSELDKNADDVAHGRFHSLQERQMEVFNDMLGRHEQFLMQLLTQQREAAEAAQERDRQFMFKLVEIFVKQK